MCRCGNTISFWENEFNIIECDKCRDKKNIKNNLAVLKTEMHNNPGGKLNLQGLALMYAAERYHLI